MNVIKYLSLLVVVVHRTLKSAQRYFVQKPKTFGRNNSYWEPQTISCSEIDLVNASTVERCHNSQRWFNNILACTL